MNLTLELPQELEKELSTEAARLGLSLSEYVVRVLSTGRAVGNTPKTGSELVAYWQNEAPIGTRPDIVDSQKHARRLRDEAERRSQA
jgi:hypothetical protein